MSAKRIQNYAQILFESDKEGRGLGFLSELKKIFAEEKPAKFFLSCSIPKEDKKSLIEKAFAGRPLIKNFFLVLLENKALPLLPKIVEAYRGLIDQKNKLCRGEAFSAAPLSADQKAELEKLLKKFLGKELQLDYKEDKKLKAGLYVKAGGYVFNSTIQQQLKKFQSKGV